MKAKLTASAERLVELLKLDAPDVILSGELVLLWECATVLFGKELYERVGCLEVQNARRRAGLCTLCDNNHSKDSDFCAECDARIDAETNDMLKAAGMEDH